MIDSNSWYFKYDLWKKCNSCMGLWYLVNFLFYNRWKQNSAEAQIVRELPLSAFSIGISASWNTGNDRCMFKKKKKANKQNFRWINVYSYFFTWKLQLVFCHYDCLHLLNLRLSELFSLYNRWTQLLDSMCMQAK